jgi:protein PhnA
MSIDKTLMQRSAGSCELCGSQDGLEAYVVTPREDAIVICSTCAESIDEPSSSSKHWNCLHDSMWSSAPAVQVMCFRLLTQLGAQDQLDMLYLEEDVKEWAEAGMHDAKAQPTRDSNGSILEEGDTVNIIKDLVVKGAGFTAKQGTTVKNIHLVPQDNTMIEGRVNGTKIFLLTKFLKKL